MQPVIYAADIGSIAEGNFGWARLDPERDRVEVDRGRGGAEIAELVEAVSRDLNDGQSVALGFECPLFVPVRKNPRKLGKARKGEDKAFSAAVGASALVTGLLETAWVLRALRKQCPDATAYLDWAEFTAAGKGLFLWEAFVSGAAKGPSHVDDAHIAVTAFRDALPNPLKANAVTARTPLSLAGAALLWSGWTYDAAVLHQPCLVIKPEAADHPQNAAHDIGGVKSPTPSGGRGSLRDWVSRVAQQIPAGRWSAYGDIAELVKDEPDTSFNPLPLSVGTTLANNPDIVNAHRILNTKGERTDAYPYRRELLVEEGVRFTNDRADQTQRWPTPRP